MAIARPVVPGPESREGRFPAAGSQTSLAPPLSETGMELEATPPAASLSHSLPAKAAIDLGEPSGVSLSTQPPDSAEEPSTRVLSGDPALDIRFERMLATVRANRPADDLHLIRSAWIFCMQQHAEQKRASGEPYVIHPLEVAQVLAELKMDSTAIAAGLLHDAVEDTDVTPAEIAKRFGEQVAHIVEGVTKLDKIKFANREDHQAEKIGRAHV